MEVRVLSPALDVGFAALATAVLAWHSAAPLPEARTEVAGAVLGRELVVAGGPKPGLFVSAANEYLGPR